MCGCMCVSPEHDAVSSLLCSLADKKRPPGMSEDDFDTVKSKIELEIANTFSWLSKKVPCTCCGNL